MVASQATPSPPVRDIVRDNGQAGREGDCLH